MYNFKFTEYEIQIILNSLDIFINELNITKSDNQNIQKKQDIIKQDTEKLINEIKEKIKS